MTKTDIENRGVVVVNDTDVVRFEQGYQHDRAVVVATWSQPDNDAVIWQGTIPARVYDEIQGGDGRTRMVDVSTGVGHHFVLAREPRTGCVFWQGTLPDPVFEAIEDAALAAVEPDDDAYRRQFPPV